MHRITTTVVTASMLAVAGPLARASFTEADVTNWTGTGDSEAVVVIDWNRGPTTSMAWGYRFDGVTDGWTMLQAIVDGDPNLYLYTDGLGGPDAVFGFGYDVDGDGFSRIADPTPDDSSDDGVAGDADDLYFEGWFDGYWSYYINQTLGTTRTETFGEFSYEVIDVEYEIPIDTVNPFAANWSSSPLGATLRNIVDGSWDGYSAAINFVDTPPSQPIPSPATAWLLGVAVMGVVSRRGRQ